MVESRGIGQSESGAISIMRILAMFSIIVCHLLQAYNNRYCWLFNIGVWVFLAISGYLYGCKVIEVTGSKPDLRNCTFLIYFFYWHVFRSITYLSLRKSV